jgi:hypothetical protein
MTMNEQLQALLARLPKCVNRDLIDKVCHRWPDACFLAVLSHASQCLRAHVCSLLITATQAAMDFCLINNKGSRRVLIDALYHVPRNRLDLLPYYARSV